MMGMIGMMGCHERDVMIERDVMVGMDDSMDDSMIGDR